MKFRVLIALALVLLLITGFTARDRTEAETADLAYTQATEPVAAASSVSEPIPDLTVHFLSIGQADCIYVECDGQTLLIDAGTEDMAAQTVNYLKRQGIEDLDYVIVTHSHHDHIGGIPEVFDAFPVGTLYAQNKRGTSVQYKQYQNSLKKHNLQITEPQLGQQFHLGAAVITFLGPVKSYGRGNDNSIVVKIEHGRRSFLLAGDMETAAELDMLNYWGVRVKWNADVLKVGHHSLDTSSSTQFVQAVSPEYAIVTASFGRADAEISRKRWLKAGAAYCRTDLLGPIVITSDGDSLDVVWSNPNAVPQYQKSTAKLKYLGDRKKMVFHMDYCDHLPTDQKLKKFSTYEAALLYGMTPCAECLQSFG